MKFALMRVVSFVTAAHFATCWKVSPPSTVLEATGGQGHRQVVDWDITSLMIALPGADNSPLFLGDIQKQKRIT